ncbi:unnamed protein product, partial [Rotaria socialis]
MIAINKEGNFYNASDWSGSDISLINSILSEHLSEQDTKTSEQNETTPTSSTIHRTVTNNCNSDNYFLPFQELMDSLHSTADKALSTHRQVNHNISTSCSSTVTTNTHNRYTNNRSHAKKKFAFDRIINNGKTLFVSGLRSDVDKNDIRSHFTGSIKVVIKQYRSTSHLKYAFVYHRTSHDAKNNIRRLINFNLLGDECHVEYANACSNISNDNQISSKRKLAIKKIPYNVSEDDLQRLFVNCRILKYCPARITYSTTRKMENKNKNESKILFGYAFIVCVDEQSAEYIITHVDQYKINGHLLDVSLYQNQRQRSAAKSPYKLFQHAYYSLPRVLLLSMDEQNMQIFVHEQIMKLTTFGGARDEDVLHWLQDTECIFDSVQLRPLNKYIAVQSYLVGFAAKWFRFNKMNIPDWSSFKIAIAQAYQPSFNRTLSVIEQR